MIVRELASWVPVPDEVLADAPGMSAQVEYLLSGANTRRLAFRERLTGWRTYTASSGVQVRLQVGWRLRLWPALHPLEVYRRRQRAKADREYEQTLDWSEQ